MKPARLLACLVAAAASISAAQSTDLTAEGKAWWAHIQYLADDVLEGRNVGTPGFEKALDYVEKQFQAIGLKPAGTAGYRQRVQLDSRTLVPDQSSLSIVRDGKDEPLVIGQDAVITARGELNGSLEAKMTFVGYGLSIPEAGWDDFAGQDMRGKVMVVYYFNSRHDTVKADGGVRHIARTIFTPD